MTTIGILRLGRVKPKYRKTHHTQNQRQFHSYAHNHEDHVEDQAETHDTSVWDEHHAIHDDGERHHVHVPVPPLNEINKEYFEASLAKPKSREREGDHPVKQIIVEDDPKMEEVVKKAWRNSTIQGQHHLELVKPPNSSGRLP